MMLSVAFILSFALVHAQSNGLNLATIRQNALNLHNQYRRAHCVNPLVLNDALNTVAQQAVNRIALTNDFTYTYPAGIGVNRHFTFTSTPFAYKGE